jgi:hypothetical protein
MTFMAGGLKRHSLKAAMVCGGVVLAALSAAACASAIDGLPLSPSPPGRQEVSAPIDSLGVRVLESNPPQYVLNVRAGLPSGCAEKSRHSAERVAETITVTVLNWMPTGSTPCTLIYGSYELNINIGSEFRPGTTYSVIVNDKRTAFVAQ